MLIYSADCDTNDTPVPVFTLTYINHYSVYLLSNNHINELITHKFDFSDEEVLAYYMSLLKTLSLKLTEHTLQFFFNEVSTTSPSLPIRSNYHHHRYHCNSSHNQCHYKSHVMVQEENDFPLYTEAVKFFNHKESMVRIAVRTLTLNVFKGTNISHHTTQQSIRSSLAALLCCS